MWLMASNGLFPLITKPLVLLSNRKRCRPHIYQQFVQTYYILVKYSLTLVTTTLFTAQVP